MAFQVDFRHLKQQDFNDVARAGTQQQCGPTNFSASESGAGG